MIERRSVAEGSNVVAPNMGKSNGCLFVLNFEERDMLLYERFGYHRTGPFGDYKEDPLSLFYEKKLDVGKLNPKVNNL